MGEIYHYTLGELTRDPSQDPFKLHTRYFRLTLNGEKESWRSLSKNRLVAGCDT